MFALMELLGAEAVTAESLGSPGLSLELSHLQNSRSFLLREPGGSVHMDNTFLILNIKTAFSVVVQPIRETPKKSKSQVSFGNHHLLEELYRILCLKVWFNTFCSLITLKCFVFLTQTPKAKKYVNLKISGYNFTCQIQTSFMLHAHQMDVCCLSFVKFASLCFFKNVFRNLRHVGGATL